MLIYSNRKWYISPIITHKDIQMLWELFFTRGPAFE